MSKTLEDPAISLRLKNSLFRLPFILTLGTCSHIAPVARLNLGPQSTLTYRYWLIVGTEKEISSTLALLWKKYSAERFSLTNSRK